MTTLQFDFIEIRLSLQDSIHCLHGRVSVKHLKLFSHGFLEYVFAILHLGHPGLELLQFTPHFSLKGLNYFVQLL